MLDCPRIISPSVSSAQRTLPCKLAGIICPRTERSFDAARIALGKLPPFWSMSAVNKILPTVCPPKSPFPEKRYSKRLATSSSASERETRSFRTSPGGKTSNSSINRPVLPPSSDTETTAANRSISTIGSSWEYFLIPLSKADNPVPPPIQTNFKGL